MIIHTEPCPLCREEGLDSAGDNLVTYDDKDDKYCVARHGFISISSELKTKVKKVTKDKQKIKFPLDGEYSELRGRGISKETCEYYGYQVNKEHQVHIANYYNESGKLVMQQLRTKDKEFPLIGNKNNSEMLYGMWKHNPDERVFLTITEGQLDALSVAEAFDCKYPVVSIPNGVSAAAKVLQKHKKYLDGFKYVVLAFDNDEPGKKATEECIKLFEPGRVRIASFKAKDANELLQQGKVSEIRDAIYRAVEYIPSPILTGNSLLATLDNYSSKTMPWPWDAANKFIAPIRIPGVYTIAAKPGVGKSEFVAELMRHVIANGGKVGVIALEQTVQQILLKLTSQITGVNLTGVSNRKLSNDEKELCKEVADNLVIYDHIVYGSHLETIVENIPYMVKALNCQLIVFDNLTYAATNISSDERKGIDLAMTKFKDTTVKYEYTLINVGHIKRSDGLDDEDEISVEQIRGSQGIELFSDCIIGLTRRTQDENLSLRNTMTVHVLKDRATGEDNGKTFKIHYDSEKRRFKQ